MNRNAIIGLLGIGLVMFGGYKLYDHKSPEPVKEQVVVVPANEAASAMVIAPDGSNPRGECLILVKGPNDEPDYIVGKCKD